MATPSYVRSLVSSAKRLRLDGPKRIAGAQQTRNVQQQRLPWHTDTNPLPLSLYTDKEFVEEPTEASANAEYFEKLAERQRGVLLPLRDRTAALPKAVREEIENLRIPKAVQATYIQPLKHKPQYGIPVADLQLRSYSVKNLNFFADFCLRAAFYLNLPAKGPVPLPRITERWTVPRGNFVHKKSQENFERVTLRRLIQIQDGHPETVAIFLAYIQKYQFYGVGMKANVWERSGVEVGKDMDAEAEKIKQRLGEKFELFGGRKDIMEDVKDIEGRLHSEPFKAAWGAYVPLGGAQSVPNANKRVEKRTVGGGYS